MRDSDQSIEMTEESRKMRELMHDIANCLHLLGLQGELAKSHVSSGNRAAATAAIEAVLRERDNCSRLTGEIHRKLREAD